MTTPRKSAKGTETQHLLLENIPRELVQAAKDKAKALTPPQNLKGLIVGLLRDWLGRA